jgi:large subunit ribosomal protein L18
MYKIRPKTTKQRRATRSHSSYRGTAGCPRLSVYRSNRYIYGQLIDDVEGITLATIDDTVKKHHSDMSKKDAAKELGKILAQRASDKGIKKVVFDKGAYKFHGRVKSFAEGVREGGLVF